MVNKNFILALSSLVGAIIGAGIFAIPYIMAKSGILMCFFYFIILGAVVFFLHLLFSEVIINSKTKHRLIGYVEKYFNKKAKTYIAIANIIGVIGSLLAYIILFGKFTSIILPNFLSPFHLSIIIWALLCPLIFLGIKSIAKAEIFLNIGLFLAVFLIFVFSFPHIAKSNFILFNNGTANLFLPFGVIMFSLIGTSAVPEATSLLKDKKSIKKIILFASIITISFSFLFGLIINGASGQLTRQDPFQALIPLLGHKIITIGALFGLFAVATSFLILSNFLKNTLKLDYKMPIPIAFSFASLIPIILFIIGIREFVLVIGIMGSFIGLIEGITIILLYRKSRKINAKKSKHFFIAPNILLYFITIILILGAISETAYYFLK